MSTADRVTLGIAVAGVALYFWLSMMFTVWSYT